MMQKMQKKSYAKDKLLESNLSITSDSLPETFTEAIEHQLNNPFEKKIRSTDLLYQKPDHI